MNTYHVNLTVFHLSAKVCHREQSPIYKALIKNTQFNKQNRRKQIWARMKSKRCKIMFTD